MNRLRLYLLALTALLVCTVKADEGMWQSVYSEEDVQEKSFHRKA